MFGDRSGALHSQYNKKEKRRIYLHASLQSFNGLEEQPGRTGCFGLTSSSSSMLSSNSILSPPVCCKTEYSITYLNLSVVMNLNNKRIFIYKI